jgi:hypothetical protein
MDEVLDESEKEKREKTNKEKRKTIQFFHVFHKSKFFNIIHRFNHNILHPSFDKGKIDFAFEKSR